MNATPGQDDDWRHPDGRQMAFNTLEQLGIEPSDAHEMYLQMARNSALMAGGGIKAAQSMERHGEKADWTPIDYGNDHDNKAAIAKRAEEDRRLDEDRRDEARRLEERRLQEKRDEEQRLEEKRAADAAAAAKRPDEDARNRQILAGVGGLMGFGLGLGLTTQAVDTFGQIMTPSLTGVGSQMAVISNGEGAQFGGLLNEMRQITGTPNPASQDIAVLGPDQTASFIPGTDPNPAPTVTAPAATLQQRNIPGAMPLPGMSGPSMGRPS